MEIIVGKTAGFCYGVKRAVEGAIEELKSNEDIFCLGEIVHNKQVINDLESKGMKFTDSLNESSGKTIIRAHGVPREIYKLAEKNNIEVKDFTCPNVLKIHDLAEEYSKSGYYIFLCGSSSHPENIGTISYCGENYSIIENEEDVDTALEDFFKSNSKKLLLIAQTTYSLHRFENIKKKIYDSLDSKIEILVKNTICRATELRQKETRELSKNVDYMIIIGGKNSSNTKKLYEIAKEECDNSACIETESELNIDEIKDFSRIGIMAGASTPQESIDKVVEKIDESK